MFPGRAARSPRFFWYALSRPQEPFHRSSDAAPVMYVASTSAGDPFPVFGRIGVSAMKYSEIPPGRAPRQPDSGLSGSSFHFTPWIATLCCSSVAPTWNRTRMRSPA